MDNIQRDLAIKRKNQTSKITNESLISKQALNNFEYERNLLSCKLKNNVSSIHTGDELIMDMNSDRCINNSLERFNYLFKNNSSYLRVVHFNAQGLMEGSHFEHICLKIKDASPDLIIISETWLKSSISNKLVNIDNYKLIRSDRNFKKTNIVKGGGGVCIYARDDYKIKRVEKSNRGQYKQIDFLIAEIQTKKMKFLICGIYRQGDCPDEETNSVFNRINVET